MPIKIDMPSGESVIVDSCSISVGTDKSCDVVLPRQGGIRPRHATIRKVAGRWMIESDGDWLLQVHNGVRGRKQWLSSGDYIRLSETGPEIVFSEQDPQESLRPASTTMKVDLHANTRIGTENTPTDESAEHDTPVLSLGGRKCSRWQRTIPRRLLALVATSMLFVAVVLLLVLSSMNNQTGTIIFAEQINARTLEIKNEGRKFPPGFVHVLVKCDIAFDDSKLIIYHRLRSSTVWSILDEDTVRPERKVCVFPIFLTEPGDYEIRVTTSRDVVLAEGDVRIVLQ